MRDEDIERTPIVDPVEQQAGKHAERPQVGFSLRILVCPIRPVADGSAEAADQKFFESHRLQIQVGPAFHVCEIILRVEVGVMVARDIEQWNVQDSQQVFKVRVGQVTTPEDQLDLMKVAARTKIIKPVHNLIAYRKNFHNGRIVPQNKLPGKGGSTGLVHETEMLLTHGWLSKHAWQTIIDKIRRRTTGNKDIS